MMMAKARRSRALLLAPLHLPLLVFTLLLTLLQQQQLMLLRRQRQPDRRLSVTNHRRLLSRPLSMAHTLMAPAQVLLRATPTTARPPARQRPQSRTATRTRRKLAAPSLR